MKKNLLSLSFVLIAFISNAQSFNEILGRPTNSSVTMSILFSQPCEVYWEFGTATGAYTNTTSTYTTINKTPLEADFTGLQANTKYYYRTRYRAIGSGGSFLAGTEHSFYTQRAPGSTFTFTVEADEHLYDIKGVKSLYQICLNNQAKDNPDFMLSLGDIFGDDHTPTSTTAADMDTLHNDYRPFLGSICHSVPFFICLGNHEGENDYYLAQTPPNNIATYATLSRKFYFPNPSPNSFYSGNTISEGYGMGLPENYFAWTWGDALFVVLDVYRTESYSTLSMKPGNWNWTLGVQQYNWLKNTLENSNAKFKFVFAHHIRGQGRGGITNAQLFEWGGLQSPGGANTFAANRPGWAKPIHQLFVDNHVNIFFQGHDHLFAHEVLDSVTYQEVPMAADSTYKIGMLANADSYTADTIGGSGHLRVTVSSTGVQVDFVQAYLPADTLGTNKNGQVAFSYTIGTLAPPTVSVGASATNICAGTSVTFTATANNAGVNPVYQWKKNGVNVGTNSNTFSSSTFVNGDTISCVITTATSSTAISNQIIMAVSSTLPSKPNVISGTKNGLCNTTANYIYSVPAVANAISYIWTVPANATIVSGQGTTSITVNFSSLFLSGIISVKSSNNCGVSALRSITVYAKPIAPGTITGPAAVCANQQNVSYSIAAVPGATSYTWAVPTGGSITSGKGTTSILAKFGTAGGNVTVLAKNSCGNSAKATLPVIINCRISDDNYIEQNSFNVINPFADEIIFSVKTEIINATISLCDLTGREISKWENVSVKPDEQQQFSIDKNLASGTYLLSIKNSNISLVSKITH